MAFNPKEYLISLKGKEYLQVAHRLMWFRDAHPQGTILTEIITFEPVVCVKATIINGDNHVLSTGHGTATAKANAVWAGREIEKAETAAIGRALAAAGFGTQFGDEYDDADDNHLSDSPQTRNNPPQQQQSEPAEKETAVTSVTVKKSKSGKPYLQFTTTDNINATAWSRQKFIDALWITENEWREGTTTINPPIPVIVKLDGEYWNIADVGQMPDPFADDNPLDDFFGKRGAS